MDAEMMYQKIQKYDIRLRCFDGNIGKLDRLDVHRYDFQTVEIFGFRSNEFQHLFFHLRNHDLFRIGIDQPVKIVFADHRAFDGSHLTGEIVFRRVDVAAGSLESDEILNAVDRVDSR